MLSHNYIIMGGGPVGCYLAYKLLSQANTRVVMFEGRKFERPQVIRIPFCIAKDIPDVVKNTMWFDEKTRTRIFNSCEAENSNFWPKPNYAYWPWIGIGLFQEAMVNFLKTNAAYKRKFFFIPSHEDVTQLDLQTEIQKFYPHDGDSIINNLSAIFCTCGNYAKSLRNNLNLMDGKSPEIKGHGLYLIYQNDKTELYERNGNPMSYAVLGEKGISYAAANNCNYDVQLYTYPEGELSAVFNEIPESFIQQAQYKSMTTALDMTGVGMAGDALQWFEHYSAVIQAVAAKANIQLPQDLTKIKVFYAQRNEYYWDVVATRYKTETPLFFLGDSAGSTDYKFGLSVGRGFLAVEELTNSIINSSHDFEKIISNYQKYWDGVIHREFNKGSQLTSEPWILYQYLIKGREVVFSENKKINYLLDSQYENFLDEYQYLCSDFSRTREAKAIIFVNASALKENIKNIIQCGKKFSDSKIIGVVKSNGYGLGLKLISELVIESGIDFLAVSKLQEAVLLRSDIASNKNVKIMVFDTPMLHDLSAYAANQIETIFPSSQDGSSVNILTKWLKNKPRIFDSPLKVHIMIDTGMRRNGGYSHNLPESVLSTITALQRLDRTQIEFAGLTTHLACYRCTDYKGEEIVNFRTLQLQRFQEVITYLLSHGVHLPLIHIGGGLGLLAEQWTKQFEYLGVQLYTRVGHGIYGMELEKDLHPDCPKLCPVVEMNFQVCNVFYVEEEEPVSYGGLWRAPRGGAWIATLAGGWAEGVPRTSQTLGEWEHGVMVSINGCQYPVVGNINMNAMMINLGLKTTVKAGDRAVIFGWRSHEPKLNDLAQLSGQIGPSIMVNVPTSMPRIVVSG